MDQSVPSPRRVTLFRDDRDQAVRIPVEFELPGQEAVISREGDRVILESVRKADLTALLDSWDDLDVSFPEIDDRPIEPKRIF